MTAESITDWKHKTCRIHRRKVFTLGWNSEGKRLASGSFDQTVRITRVDEHCSIKQEAELRGHGDGVTNLAWHPTHPDKLASIAGQEKSVRFWDTRVSKNTATVSTPSANLYMSWSPDAHYVAVSSRDDIISIIDARKMKVAHKHPYKYQVNEIAFAKEGKEMLVCTGEGEAEILSFPDMRKLHSLKGHTNPVLSVAVDRKNKYICTGGADAVACLWDTQDYICQRTFIAMDYPIRCLSFSHDARYLCIAGEQTTIDIENLDTGLSLGRLQMSNTPEDVAFNPRHYMLAYSGGWGKDNSGMDFGEIEFRWK